MKDLWKVTESRMSLIQLSGATIAVNIVQKSNATTFSTLLLLDIKVLGLGCLATVISLCLNRVISYQPVDELLPVDRNDDDEYHSGGTGTRGHFWCRDLNTSPLASVPAAH